ncbi:hypothetical protein EYF80_014686 [Liparis tanakae]|uniref:Uncharacterized protein n=1 Tax=Liparis tanakae TaxID=230148 RepID=A0A4Z2IDJ3_9TELE|nr:hypothetical protein EYF80_014686 [Liparis tanakae]
MEVMPSNLKPSKQYSSIHQRRFDTLSSSELISSDQNDGVRVLLQAELIWNHAVPQLRGMMVQSSQVPTNWLHPAPTGSTEGSSTQRLLEALRAAPPSHHAHLS